MSDDDQPADKGLIESTWAEARDLVKRLEGSTVQRLAVKAGEYEIEIERGTAAPPAAGGGEIPLPRSTSFAGAGLGPGVAPEARGPSGAFAALDEDADNRVPVLAPLVGTFYEAAQPGADPFVTVGDTVEQGQTVCIVEAMKLMNEVEAPESGKVAEIAASNGEAVEFEQVLLYIEPDGE